MHHVYFAEYSFSFSPNNVLLTLYFASLKIFQLSKEFSSLIGMLIGMSSTHNEMICHVFKF